MKRLYIVALCFTLLTTVADAKTVYLVRHAEKVNDGSKDPKLSLLGQQRAQNIADMLSHADIRHIYSTDYQRTQSTAQPLAEYLGIEVQSYDPTQLAAFADKVKQQAGNALIVGHSNTTPMLTYLLSNLPVMNLDESHYDNVFQVVIENEQATLHVLKSEPSQASQALNRFKPLSERFFDGELVFNMSFKGEVVGQSKHQFRHKNHRYQLSETTRIESMNINAIIDTELDSKTLSPISLKMSGTMGTAVDIKLNWQGDQVTGHSAMSRAPFKKQGKILLDEKLRPQTLERTGAIMLAHLMPVTETQPLQINWFNGYDGHSNLIKMSYQGDEQITVPAGTFDTYKIKYSGGAPSQYFWIDKKQAKVIKIEVIHMPWVYELAAVSVK